MRFGIENMQYVLVEHDVTYTIHRRSCLVEEGQQKVTSLSCHQSRVMDGLRWQYNHAADVAPPLTALDLLPK